jgi:hypothetical protein
VKERLERIEQNARAKLNESAVKDDSTYYKRHAHIPREPIFIASTEDIGTKRVLCNHIDAALDYCYEQEKLKAAGAPI